MNYLLLATSLTIASIAAFYSIAGLTVIFAGAVIPIAIMASALEVGKLVTAHWLHKHWRRIPLLVKGYLTSAVLALMLVTSTGIFGYLSKAHLEQSVKIGGTNELQVQLLQSQVEQQRNVQNRAIQSLSLLDAQIQTLVEYDKISGENGAIATQELQKGSRGSLDETIAQTQIRINELQRELEPLLFEQISMEAEIGPLIYIAELIYGDEADKHFDKAVRWIIILLVLVFDPLAIMLLLASNYRFPKEDEKGNYILRPEDVHDVDDMTLKSKKKIELDKLVT
jgi:hypothetical protein